MFVAFRVCDDGRIDRNSGFVLLLVGFMVVNVTCFLFSLFHRIIHIVYTYNAKYDYTDGNTHSSDDSYDSRFRYPQLLSDTEFDSN